MAHLRGNREESSQRIPAGEVKEIVAKAEDEARTNTRNELLTELYADLDVTQKELAGAVGLSRSRLADIVS
jgi:hypothetical protein